MPLPPNFPDSPHDILEPSQRWTPETGELEFDPTKLFPPLVSKLRQEVKAFRDSGYAGASDTSRALLTWWFGEVHMMPQADGVSTQFQYYFAQRESVETVIWLYEVAGARSAYDLLRYDSSGAVSAGMFDEDWTRYVIKMATGSGKTKVMSLLLAWSFFHKTYEAESNLSRNFLVIAPNIIVLDRIRDDFDGLKVFFEDPVLPDNGWCGQNWREDFQLRLHIQDDVRVVQPTGNIFLTNIHRVYAGNESVPTPDDDDTMDYFLGTKVTGKTTDNQADLGLIVRDIDELMVINDEAHHIHDSSLAWFQSIRDIHHQLLQKDDRLSLQIDVTATPKHNNGAIFVQTVSDYPLVEAISQNVVKHPVLPDESSRNKLTEQQSSKFTERYADYLDLGVVEWRKAYAHHKKLRKKAILFVMTDDTKNCDEVAQWLQDRYPDLKDAVLTIHTNKQGQISEAQSKAKQEELDFLREQANCIDSWDSPYRAVVSVLMLKEGWDVRNVTTIVGLRAYSAKSNILPEQTLGRGLRKMYPGGYEEYVSVMGTDAFMEFVESIQAEGVELERGEMGGKSKPKTPLIVEVDHENASKNLDELDISIPVLAPRLYREFQNLENLDPANWDIDPLSIKQFSEEEQRTIVFRDITTQEISHETNLNDAGIGDWRSIIGFFTNSLIRDLRLVGGYDHLYPVVRNFIRNHLFGKSVDLDDRNIQRNLAEPISVAKIDSVLKTKINELTIADKGSSDIQGYISLKDMKPFVVKNQPYILGQKTVFNRTVGDNSDLELRFAKFLEDSNDVAAYGKNYLAVGFKLDYQKVDGSLSTYTPDFFVKTKSGDIYIVETKGREEIDVPQKMARLQQWCDDVNSILPAAIYKPLYVGEDNFNKYDLNHFNEAAEVFAYSD